MENTREKQELYCHDCGKYVQFEIDASLDGNHTIECPNCGHEHCRVVDNGVITEARWSSRNSSNTSSYTVTNATYTTTSTYDTYMDNYLDATTSVTSYTYTTSGTSSSTSGTGDIFLYQAWLNTGIG